MVSAQRFGRSAGRGCRARRDPQTVPTSTAASAPSFEPVSQQTLPWRKQDSNLYGAFPVKPSFLVVVGSLFGAGKPFFVPSPAIRFAERAEGVKGPKR